MPQNQVNAKRQPPSKSFQPPRHKGRVSTTKAQKKSSNHKDTKDTKEEGMGTGNRRRGTLSAFICVHQRF